MSCITCGLDVTRVQCPVIVDKEKRRALIKGRRSYNPETFKVYPVKLGYFSFTAKGLHWHNVPKKAPHTADCAPKTILQAKAVFEGFKVLRRDTKADLEGLRNGPFKAQMKELEQDMRKEWLRRQEEATAAQEAAEGSDSATDGASQSAPTVPLTVRTVQEAQASSNSRSQYNTVRPVLRPNPAPVPPLRTQPPRTFRAFETSAASSVSSPSPVPVSPPAGSASTLRYQASASPAHPPVSSPLAPVTVPAVVPTPSNLAAPRSWQSNDGTAGSLVCVACRQAVHPGRCVLERGVFDVPDTFFHPVTFRPTPVTFGNFTCAPRGDDGVVAGWKDFYSVEKRGRPRLRWTVEAPAYSERLIARAVLMGHPLNVLDLDTLNSTDEHGPFYDNVRAFLESMETEYQRRGQLAEAAQLSARMQARTAGPQPEIARVRVLTAPSATQVMASSLSSRRRAQPRVVRRSLETEPVDVLSVAASAAIARCGPLPVPVPAVSTTTAAPPAHAVPTIPPSMFSLGASTAVSSSAQRPAVEQRAATPPRPIASSARVARLTRPPQAEVPTRAHATLRAPIVPPPPAPLPASPVQIQSSAPRLTSQSSSDRVADVAPAEPEPARRGLLASLYDAIFNPLGFLDL
ncbi:hypothetical protein EXIGLDRAFT_743727 [Exidia glandulosa HHB12029]|uniref:Uncharacterized protein n=1 Tax=Exidia glandulosa HHB12029 TaxID=1314781 RepID=A0A165QWD1_EXIGL|nr:hypothetical protein EXIGLDRAFT_743727 [Exidia glandulosa HHB12029]